MECVRLRRGRLMLCWDRTRVMEGWWSRISPPRMFPSVRAASFRSASCFDSRCRSTELDSCLGAMRETDDAKVCCNVRLLKKQSTKGGREGVQAGKRKEEEVKEDRSATMRARRGGGRDRMRRTCESRRGQDGAATANQRETEVEPCTRRLVRPTPIPRLCRLRSGACGTTSSCRSVG